MHVSFVHFSPNAVFIHRINLAVLTISPGAKLRTATKVKKVDGLTYSCSGEGGLIAVGVSPNAVPGGVGLELPGI